MSNDEYETLGEFYELQQYKRYAVSYMNKFFATPEDIVNKEFDMESLLNGTEHLMEKWDEYQDMLVPMLQWQVGSTPLAIHSYNVGSIAYLIGNDMHLSKEDMKLLTISALGHDIGKYYISPMILDKDGALGITEKSAMQQHPWLGAVFVQNHYPEFDKIIPETILMHHEVEDGSGYYGYKKNEIPVYAKIIRAADIFCALTEDRSYHMSKSCRQSLSKLKEFPYMEKEWIEILSKRTSQVKEVKNVIYLDGGKKKAIKN